MSTTHRPLRFLARFAPALLLGELGNLAPARAETPPHALHAVVIGPTAADTGADLPALVAPLARAVAASGGSLSLLIGEAATAPALGPNCAASPYGSVLGTSASWRERPTTMATA